MRIETLFAMGMDRDIAPLVDPPEGLKLNLGAGKKWFDKMLSLDLPKWDADTMPIPYEDGSVAAVFAFHFLEHVREPVRVLREIERVLKFGGVANIVVPYYRSQMAFQDLDHKSFWCEETWRVLFRNPYYDKMRGKGWGFSVGTNIIIGVAERNLALMTQLIRVG